MKEYNTGSDYMGSEEVDVVAQMATCVYRQLDIIAETEIGGGKDDRSY